MKDEFSTKLKAELLRDVREYKELYLEASERADKEYDNAQTLIAGFEKFKLLNIQLGAQIELLKEMVVKQ